MPTKQTAASKKSNNHILRQVQTIAKQKPLLALSAVLVVIVLAVGGAFALYIPNKPTNVYSAGIKNTAKAVDKLIAYSQTVQKQHYNSVAVTGSATISGGLISLGAQLNGQFDAASNGQLNATVTVAGKTIRAQARSLPVAASKTPDVYLKVTGIDQLLKSLTPYDGKWLVIDHSLLTNYADTVQSKTGTIGLMNVGLTSTPTPAQTADAEAKVQAVNKQYLFTDDPARAVITKQSFVGQETKDGRRQDHYTVTTNKQHLQAYLAAIKTALDSSRLTDWATKNYQGKSLSQLLAFDAVSQKLSSVKNGYSFDLWVDVGTKLISSIQFTDPKDASTLTIGQHYTGGDTYPLSLAVSTKQGNGTLLVTLDSAKNTATVGVNASLSKSITIKSNSTLTPSSSRVHVTAPTNAEPATDVLQTTGTSSL